LPSLPTLKTPVEGVFPCPVITGFPTCPCLGGTILSARFPAAASFRLLSPLTLFPTRHSRVFFGRSFSYGLSPSFNWPIDGVPYISGTFHVPFLENGECSSCPALKGVQAFTRNVPPVRLALFFPAGNQVGLSCGVCLRRTFSANTLFSLGWGVLKAVGFFVHGQALSIGTFFPSWPGFVVRKFNRFSTSRPTFSGPGKQKPVLSPQFVRAFPVLRINLGGAIISPIPLGLLLHILLLAESLDECLLL